MLCKITRHICFTTKTLLSIMPIAKDTWELIKDAVKNKTLADVCEIYRTNNLEYADVSVHNNSNLLHLSSLLGKLDIVRFCVEEKGFDVDSGDHYGETALHLAADWGHLQVLQHLLSSGADVNVKNDYGDTALHVAARGGHLQVVQHLLSSGADVNVKNVEGNTALHKAAGWGHLQVVQFLLSSGADVNMKDNDGYTALHWAADLGHLQVVQHLLSSGADVNMKDNDGDTALHLAADGGHLQVLQHILSSGADVNMQNNKGETALFLAVQAKKLQVAEYIMKNGGNHLETAARSRQVKVVYFLLGVSVDMFSEKFNEGALLSAAVRDTQLETFRYLLTEGLKTEVREEYTNKALIRHVEIKNIQGAAAVVYLCFLANKEVGVENFDINSKYAEEQTVLMWAARHGELDIVKYLNEQGADLTPSDSSGNTALQLAGLNYQLSVVDYLLDVQEVKSDEFNSLLLNISEFAQDPSRMFVLYQGDFYKSLIKIFSRVGDQATKQQGMLLKHIYIALQAKCRCSTPKHKIEKTINNELSSRNKVEDDKVATKEKEMLKELLGQELYGHFKKKIEKIRNDQENLIDEKRNRWLIANKIHSKYIKRSNSCVRKMKSNLITCCKSAKIACNCCLECCSGKRCIKKTRYCTSKLPEPPHKCNSRGNFALISCSLAVLFYMLDLITDFTVGFEDYNGFSKKLGIFEMFLVVFTLMHENIRSSMSLFETEEELLRIKLGKKDITTYDWDKSDLLRSESAFKQILIKVFCPFAVRKKDGCLQCFKAVIYNLLTIFQLRPVVDRLRVLMHSPTNLRVIYRHRTEQDSLKQFYLITEQIPELLIQFYTLQIVFNIAGGAKSGDNQMFSDCGSGHNFSYPRFTDSLNNPNKTSWFCNELPIDTARGLMKCEIFFRLFSAMIPFIMIPSGIVSLEVGLRLLDAATPKMSATVQYLLQAAYTLMIPARLLMFAALMHAVSVKEIIFGYVLLRVALELLSNRFSIGDLDRFFSTNVNKRLLEQENRSWVKKLKGSLSKLYNFSNTIWRISMFSVRDVFAVSIREPQAYMISPSNVTYKSIRQRNSLTKRCAIFLLEGLVGAWIIEEFYPCGRHSEIFRYIGWMCLASLLLSLTVMTLISDLLHPQYLLTDDKDVLKRLISTAGLSVLFGVVSSLVFIITQLRTSTEKWVFFGIAVHVLTSGILILVIKFFAYPSEKKGKDIEDSAEMKASESAQSCYLGLCCPSLSFHKYSKVSKGSTEDMVNESQKMRAAIIPKNMVPSEFREMNPIETSKAMTMEPCREETDLNNLRGTVHEKNTEVIISQQPLSYEIIPKQVSTEGTVLEQTSSDEEVPEQTSLNEEVPKQKFVGEEVQEQKSSNEKVPEQTSSIEEVREQTSSKDKVREQTSSKDKAPEQTSSNEEVREQISSKDKAPEQTSSIEEVREQISSKDKVPEQTSSKDKVPEQTSSIEEVREQTSSKDKVQEQTSSNEEVREQTSSKDKVPEQTSSKDKVLEQPSSIDEVREQASFKNKAPEQTSSNEEVREQTSSKDKVPEQTSSKDKVPEQTSSNEEVREQISSKDKIPEQTSSKDKVPEQTSSKDKVPEQTSSKDKVLEQPSSID